MLITLSKRIFDILLSLSLMILLSPVFLVLSLLIYLECKGPIFYYTYRVGINYNIFKFFQFRTMRTDSYRLIDQLNYINSLKNLNSVPLVEKPFSREQILSINPKKIRVNDFGILLESEYESKKKELNSIAFLNIENDARSTLVGRLIRILKLYKLPQLFNMFLGDMTLIGNKSLSLHEAEQLTSDESIGRFKEPIGLIGLWQGKSEKIEIDTYSKFQTEIWFAQEYDFWKEKKF